MLEAHLADTVRLTVSALSGRSHELCIEIGATVWLLRQRVAHLFGAPVKKLILPDGSTLNDPTKILANTGLKEEPYVQVLLGLPVKVCSIGSAFAFLKEDGTVRTWGNPLAGGTFSDSEAFLHDICEFFSSDHAFTALREDGNLVTWASFANKLYRPSLLAATRIVKISSTTDAFAALSSNGELAFWGNAAHYVTVRSVHRASGDIVDIYSNDSAFAAVTASGGVLTWGTPTAGGDSSTVQHLLHDVYQIFSTRTAFTAVRFDGTVVTWGTKCPANANPECSYAWVNEHVNNVSRVFTSSWAFAALLKDGTVRTWGHTGAGGNCSAVRERLVDVQSVSATATSQHHGGCCSIL